MKIYLIVGLPGSGKSTRLRWLYARGFTILDDIKDLSELPEAGSVDELAIADIKFCIDKNLQTAIQYLNNKYSNSNISVIYFENAPDKCLRNVALRNDGRLVTEMIKQLSKVYNPPNTAWKIWEPNN